MFLVWPRFRAADENLGELLSRHQWQCYLGASLNLNPSHRGTEVAERHAGKGQSYWSDGGAEMEYQQSNPHRWNKQAAKEPAQPSLVRHGQQHYLTDETHQQSDDH